jgi:hypothetical protein
MHKQRKQQNPASSITQKLDDRDRGIALHVIPASSIMQKAGYRAIHDIHVVEECKQTNTADPETDLHHPSKQTLLQLRLG